MVLLSLCKGRHLKSFVDDDHNDDDDPNKTEIRQDYNCYQKNPGIVLGQVCYSCGFHADNSSHLELVDTMVL